MANDQQDPVPQLSALHTLTTYINTHSGEIPRDPNALVYFSRSESDLQSVSYSDAQTVIKSYRKNLRRLRQGKVSYNERTGSIRARSVSRSHARRSNKKKRSSRTTPTTPMETQSAASVSAEESQSDPFICNPLRSRSVPNSPQPADEQMDYDYSMAKQGAVSSVISMETESANVSLVSLARPTNDHAFDDDTKLDVEDVDIIDNEYAALIDSHNAKSNNMVEEDTKMDTQQAFNNKQPAETKTEWDEEDENFTKRDESGCKCSWQTLLDFWTPFGPLKNAHAD